MTSVLSETHRVIEREEINSLVNALGEALVENA